MEEQQYHALLSAIERGNADAAATRERVEELRVALQGHLTDHTQPGLIADVRALKEHEASRLTMYRISLAAAVTSVIGAIVAALVAAVTGRHGG